jgi:hypothetical protein
VQWVGTCKRIQSDPTKHAPAMMLARPPLSLVRVYLRAPLLCGRARLVERVAHALRLRAQPLADRF